MDYERMQKPQHGNGGSGGGGGGGGGGLSPGKLRNILLMAVDKKRRAEVEIEDPDSSDFDLRSQLSSHPDANRGSSAESCKDVDIVNVVPECSATATADSTAKIERTSQRASLAPFSKPLPSKWNDAQKWIASPTSNKSVVGQGKDEQQGAVTRKTGLFGRQLSAKVVLEVPDQRMAASGEPDTKRIDSSKESGGHRVVGWDAYPNPAAESYGKPILMIENSIGESAINLSQHDAMAIHRATTFIPPPSTARSVSMRDMGTEMTPIASQEPSRTGTPAKATTPTRSPSSSRPSTPPRGSPSLPDRSNNQVNSNAELSEKELQMKTRREIMVLGTQLGKLNIAAWASKEEEDNAASTSLRTDPIPVHQPAKSAIESRAAAWEEAEKAKYMARFKREEMKIEAWENHQKAKTEAEMRKIEMEVERIRGRAQDKLMNKLAAARHKAEERRAAAEARRTREATKTEQQAEYIRKTGRIPSSFRCCGWCS